MLRGSRRARVKFFRTLAELTKRELSSTDPIRRLPPELVDAGQEALFLADRVLVLSARPGRLKADIPAPSPRPRPLSIQRTPAFVALEAEIWSLLEPPADLIRAGA